MSEMNIFVTNIDPYISAQVLPDKHVVKMPLETCQMLSIIYSKWYYDWGELHKKDGTAYFTEKGAFRNHPCTQWAAESLFNTAWLIQHGCALVDEYKYRYGKIHGCARTLSEAKIMFHMCASEVTTCYCMVKSFTRAMPDEWKYDKSIDTITAYKRYINSKPWVKDNYLRKPERKPSWIK
tara:strand:+ start:155 stop:694 length:540 start_codon:yes stop_codon:yes gene_type:complete